MKTNKELERIATTDFRLVLDGDFIRVKRVEQHNHIDDVQYSIYFQNPVNNNWYENIAEFMPDIETHKAFTSSLKIYGIAKFVIDTNATRYTTRIGEVMEAAENLELINIEDYLKLDGEVSRETLNLKLLAELIEDKLSWQDDDNNEQSITGELRAELKKIDTLINGRE